MVGAPAAATWRSIASAARSVIPESICPYTSKVVEYFLWRIIAWATWVVAPR